jgi:DNA polymerase zeta
LNDTPGVPSDGAVREKQNMSIFSLELFGKANSDFYDIANLLAAACSHGERVPNTDVNEIVAVFYSFQDSANDTSRTSHSFKTGKVVVNNKPHLYPARLRDITAHFVDNELDLINDIVDIITDLDPDIVLGWEVQSASWGYLNARCAHYGSFISFTFNLQSS